MTGPGTDGFLPLRPGHGVYILGKKVRECLHGQEPGVSHEGGRLQGPRAPMDEGGWACRRLGPQLLHPHLPPQPRTRFHSPRKASLRLLPCTPGPRAFPTSTPGTHSRVRGRATSGRQVGWGRAAAGGQVEGVEVEQRGLQTGGGPWAHSCIAAGGGPGGTQPGTQRRSGERGGQGCVGPSVGRLQDGWGPKEGVSPTARAALGASASLFLGINIYRFICRLPYTLGCLPPSKNRAGFPTPTLPVPTRAGDSGDQVRPFCSP